MHNSLIKFANTKAVRDLSKEETSICFLILFFSQRTVCTDSVTEPPESSVNLCLTILHRVSLK